MLRVIWGVELIYEVLSSLVEILPILFVCGLSAGFLAGLFGLGGGVVIVPTVFFVLERAGVDAGLAMSMAVATSLAAIIPTGMMSALNHHRFGSVDWLVVKRWSLPLGLGVVVGSTMVSLLRTPWLIVAFGIFLMAISLYALVKLLRTKRELEGRGLSVVRQSALVSLIGFISALVGVGGGTMSVPLLLATGSGAHRAVGTSSALGVVIAVVATLWIYVTVASGDVVAANSWGLIYWPALLILLPLTLITAPLGVKAAQKLPAQQLTVAFCAVMALIATRMLWVAIHSLG